LLNTGPTLVRQSLSVIGRTTSMRFCGTTDTLEDIGRRLGADYLVEGTLRTGNGRYRITSRLIRSRDQIQVWTETYDREASDLLALQSELGGAIAQQIGIRLPKRPDRRRAPRHTICTFAAAISTTR
jgi:adenylate cyclase